MKRQLADSSWKASAALICFIGGLVVPDSSIWVLLALAGCLGAFSIFMFLWDASEKKKKAKEKESSLQQILHKLNEPPQVQRLKQAVSTLPQEDLGNGIKHARIPDGTTAVTMPDGEIRLAFPITIRASMGSPTSVMDLKPSLLKDRSGEDSRGGG